jgi:hypothetical protein
MSVFPTCQFALRLDSPDNRLIAGRTNRGWLILDLPEPVSRAERVELTFRCNAWAVYGSGKNRSTWRRGLLWKPLGLELPEGGLAAGRHTIPFTVDIPDGVGQAFAAYSCGMEHLVELRLDVDWAVDPTAQLVLFTGTARPPVQAAKAPLSLRTPSSFHPVMAVELDLASQVIVQDQTLEGSVAIRFGHNEDFVSLSVILYQGATITMGRGDLRLDEVARCELDASALRRGETVRFRFSTQGLPYDEANGSIDLKNLLRLQLDPGPLSSNRYVDIPLTTLHRGSAVVGGSAPQLLGSSRLHVLASALAAESGLAVGRHPILVEGRDASVAFNVEDGARDGELGAIVSLAFLPLGLGLRSREAGVFVAKTEETPAALEGRYVVRSEPNSPHVPKALVRAFLEQLCLGLDAVELLQLSDHRLSLRVPMTNDDGASWQSVVALARRQARGAALAIGSLPFTAPGALPEAWAAAAREEHATLHAHLPALFGLVRSVPTLAGEQRRFTADLVTAWDEGGRPTTQLHVQLHDVELPEAVRAPGAVLDGEGMRAFRAHFPEVEVETPSFFGGVAPGVVSDPRKLLPALDAAVQWVLDVRGERRVDAPYR